MDKIGCGFANSLSNLAKKPSSPQQHSLRILLIAILMLLVSPKHDLNSLINSSNFFNKGDCGENMINNH